MESPCRMVSCIFHLMLLSALAISTSLSPDSLFLLCLYLFGGANSVIRWEKRIPFFFFFGHITFQLNQLLDLVYCTAYKQLLLQNWKQHRNRYTHLGTRAAYATAASRKDISRAMPSVAAEFEPDLWAPLNNCSLENLFNSAARGK